MSRIIVDPKIRRGKIKPMHAVNNGPLAEDVRGNSNFDIYKSACIPYARNHDASFYSGFGGEHTVDVHRIFKNFDADENDPRSYEFSATDKYLADIYAAGTKVFYRLGASIEHGYKYGTYPPKDFDKWARICEKIIRHYNYGWNNGFEYGIEYWEIWNEPDCRNGDGSNPCWQGSEDQFIDLYCTAAKHLKTCFPEIKIGGPAFVSPWRNDFHRGLFKRIKEQNVPFDFYSYHCYAKTPEGIYEATVEAYEALKEFGLEDREYILNEWNYVKGWIGDDWRESIDAWKGLKGASFIAGTMCRCQYSPVSMMMFYDARPCSMCSMFETDRPWIPLKGYYPFVMFGKLYDMENAVCAKTDDSEIYAAAAENEGTVGLMFTYFSNEETAEKSVRISVGNDYSKAKIYLLDGEKNNDMIGEADIVDGELTLSVKLYQTYYLEIK